MRLEPVKDFGRDALRFHANGLTTEGMTDGTVGEKIRELRIARGMSQEQLAAKVGVVQMTISKMERGIMKRPSFSTLMGIANALGVSVADLDDAGVASVNLPRIAPTSDPRPPEEDETPLESALFAVMDSKKYRAPVFDAARRVIRETYRFTREDADLEAQARSYLEAAARLHREGKPMTTAAVLAYVINGSLPGAAEVAKERAAALTDQADAELRAKGMEPGQGSDRLKAAVARRTGKGG